MGLGSLIIALIVVGLLLFLVNKLPLDATIKQIIWVIVIVFIIIWLIQSLGLLSGLDSIRIGR